MIVKTKGVRGMKIWDASVEYEDFREAMANMVEL